MGLGSYPSGSLDAPPQGGAGSTENARLSKACARRSAPRSKLESIKCTVREAGEATSCPVRARPTVTSGGKRALCEIEFNPMERVKHQKIVLPLSAVKSLRIRKPIGPLRIAEVTGGIDLKVAASWLLTQ